jgi:DNA-binding IclR family transcriptional regulator
VSFNAQINKLDATDAPVTASNGQPLPADGGAPGQAYLAFIKAVEATNSLKELAQVLETSLSAMKLEEGKKSLAKIPAAEE